MASLSKKISFLWLSMGLLGLTFGMGCEDEEAPEPTLAAVTYEELDTWLTAQAQFTLIDVREPADFAAGHIQNAINIPLSTLIDVNTGQLINNGAALTSVVIDKNQPIVTYCFGWGNEFTFAKLAIDLGYMLVYYYPAGTNEWDNKPNYYVIEYEAFKQWHMDYSPFDDGANFLIDDLTAEWYAGTDPEHPEGHIPCAVNLPVELWADSSGVPINGGAAFTSLVPNLEAKVIIYCGNPACGKSLFGVKAAVALGYTNVFRYQGGQSDWLEHGEPTVLGPDPCPIAIE